MENFLLVNRSLPGRGVDFRPVARTTRRVVTVRPTHVTNGLGRLLPLPFWSVFTFDNGRKNEDSSSPDGRRFI